MLILERLFISLVVMLPSICISCWSYYDVPHLGGAVFDGVIGGLFFWLCACPVIIWGAWVLDVN